GDECNPHDHGYLFLRGFWRFYPIKKFIEAAPSSWVSQIGSYFSQTSRKFSNNRGRPEEAKERIRDIVRTYARTLREKKDFDLLVTGHTHVSDDFQFENMGKKVRSINLGSWYEPPHYLEIDHLGNIH